MDFACPSVITNAMTQRIDQGIFGYTDTPSDLTEVFVRKVYENTEWKIQDDWVVWIPGGVSWRWLT